MVRLRALPVVGVLALAACADNPIEPVAPLAATSAIPVMSVRADAAGVYLVQFKNDRIPADFSASVQSIGGTVLFAHAPTGLAIVRTSTARAATDLSGLPGVDGVEPDAYTVLEHPRKHRLKSKAFKDPSTALAFVGQWNLPAIKAPDAWAKGKVGSRSVLVGILDSGIDYLHPEFLGLMDAERSISFVEEEVPDGAEPYADLSGHGTLVASLAVSNAELTAGVSARPRLVAIKVCNVVGECSIGATLAGILHAADERLDVINLSAGHPMSRDELKHYAPGVNMLRAIRAAFNYANRRGTSVVVSAGNDAIDMDRDKGSFQLYCDAPKVICVSATGPTFANLNDEGVFVDIENIDAPAIYSNFGGKVTVAAPGGNLFEGGSTFVDIIGACSGFIPECLDGGVRGHVVNFHIGTSFAAPHVTGLVALLASEHHFGGRPDRIASRIKRTADDLGRRGRDPHYGYGRINVARALDFRYKSNDRDSDSDGDSDR